MGDASDFWLEAVKSARQERISQYQSQVEDIRRRTLSVSDGNVVRVDRFVYRLMGEEREEGRTWCVVAASSYTYAS